MKFLSVAMAVTAIFAAGCATTPVAPPASDAPFAGYAIVGATVLPMEVDERLEDQTVLVSGDRIAAVGPSTRTQVPDGATVIDGRGKVVMPGLVDMHVHLSPTTGEPGDPAQRALAVMLAHGVTTARGMAGSPQNLVVRGKIEAGALPGPRLYAAAPALNFKTVADAEAARTAVREAKAANYDLIKMHHLEDPAIWAAAQQEAERLGIPTAGHVTNPVGLQRALSARQQIEHLDSLIVELLPADHPAKKESFGQVPPPEVIRAAAAASDAQIAALAKRIAAADGWQVPTLSLFETILDISRTAQQLRADPAMRYVPDAVLDQWTDQFGQLAKAGFSKADTDALILLRRRLAGALHRAGVPLMAGSDTAQMFHIWGPALHKEIAALQAAGLAPMESLRAATILPRNYFRTLANTGSGLGWTPNFGTVRPGARADLILLNGDPTRDLRVLERPEVVIAGGRFYDRAALDLMLDRAAAAAKTAPSPPPPAITAQKPVFVIRHLQKGAGDDPSLTAEGAAGAARLAQRLKNSGITAVFATPTRRAMETAAPLAKAAGVEVTPYDPRNPSALVAMAASSPGAVLVVGHSNTVPDLVESFGGENPGPMTEEEYGTLFEVKPDGSVERRSL